jgi:hypothetical protein
VDESTQAEIAQEPLAPERKARMAARLAWMLAVGVGSPFLCVVLIANALMPCLHDTACKGKRGWLLGGLAVFLTVAMGLLARRAMRAALDRADTPS